MTTTQKQLAAQARANQIDLQERGIYYAIIRDFLSSRYDDRVTQLSVPLVLDWMKHGVQFLARSHMSGRSKREVLLAAMRFLFEKDGVVTEPERMALRMCEAHFDGLVRFLYEQFVLLQPSARRAWRRCLCPRRRNG